MEALIPHVEQGILDRLPEGTVKEWGHPVKHQTVKVHNVTFPTPTTNPDRTAAILFVTLDVPPTVATLFEKGNQVRLTGDGANLSAIQNQTQFKENLLQSLRDGGANASEVSKLTIELTNGSIIVTYRGPPSAIAAVRGVLYLNAGKCYNPTSGQVQDPPCPAGLMSMSGPLKIPMEVNGTRYDEVADAWSDILASLSSSCPDPLAAQAASEFVCEGILGADATMPFPIGGLSTSTGVVTQTKIDRAEDPANGPTPAPTSFGAQSPGIVAPGIASVQPQQAGGGVTLAAMGTGVILASLFVCFGSTIRRKMKPHTDRLMEKMGKGASSIKDRMKDDDKSKIQQSPNCSECKAPCTDDMYCCRRCGHPRPCLGCGAVFTEDSLFCRLCGKERPKEVCRNCRTEFEDHHCKFCRICGAPRIDLPQVRLLRQTEEVPAVTNRLHLSFDGNRVKFAYGQAAPPPLPDRTDKSLLDLEESIARDRLPVTIDVKPASPIRRRAAPRLPPEPPIPATIADWSSGREVDWDVLSDEGSFGARTPQIQSRPTTPCKTSTAGTAAALSWAQMPVPDAYWEVDEDEYVPPTRLPIQLPRTTSKSLPDTAPSTPGWSEQAEAWDDDDSYRQAPQRRHSWSGRSDEKTQGQPRPRRSRPGTPHTPERRPQSSGSLARSDSIISSLGNWSDQLDGEWDDTQKASTPRSASRSQIQRRPGSAAPMLLGTAGSAIEMRNIAAMADAGNDPPTSGRRLHVHEPSEVLALDDMEVRAESTLRPESRWQTAQFVETLRNNLPHSVPETNIQWQQDRPSSSGTAWSNQLEGSWESFSGSRNLEDQTLSPRAQTWSGNFSRSPRAPDAELMATTQPLRRALDYFGDSALEATPPNTVPDPNFQRGHSRASRDPNSRRSSHPGGDRPGSAPSSRQQRMAAAFAVPDSSHLAEPRGRSGSHGHAEAPQSSSYWQDQLRKAQRARPSTGSRSRPTTPVLARPPLIPEKAAFSGEAEDAFQTEEDTFYKRARTTAESSVTTIPMQATEKQSMTTMPLHDQYLEASAPTPRRDAFDSFAGEEQWEEDNWGSRDDDNWQDRLLPPAGIRPPPYPPQAPGVKASAAFQVPTGLRPPSYPPDAPGVKAPSAFEGVSPSSTVTNIRRSLPPSTWSQDLDTRREGFQAALSNPPAQITMADRLSADGMSEEVLPGVPMTSTSGPAPSKPPRLPDLPMLPQMPVVRRWQGLRDAGAGSSGGASPAGVQSGRTGTAVSSGSPHSWKDDAQDGQSPYSRPVAVRIGERPDSKRLRTGDQSQRSWSQQVESGWETDSGSCTVKQSPSTTPKASLPASMGFTRPLRMAGMAAPGPSALDVDIGELALGIPPPPPPIDFELLNVMEGQADLSAVDGRSFHVPLAAQQPGSLPGAMPGSPLARSPSPMPFAYQQPGGLLPGAMPGSPHARSRSPMGSVSGGANPLASTTASWSRQVDDWGEWGSEAA